MKVKISQHKKKTININSKILRNVKIYKNFFFFWNPIEKCIKRKYFISLNILIKNKRYYSKIFFYKTKILRILKNLDYYICYILKIMLLFDFLSNFKFVFLNFFLLYYLFIKLNMPINKNFIKYLNSLRIFFNKKITHLKIN